LHHTLCSLLEIVAQTLIGTAFKVKQNILRKSALPQIKMTEKKSNKNGSTKKMQTTFKP
jgi:hypothetical protein